MATLSPSTDRLVARAPGRWFRFSLRTFIVFVALVACGLGWLSWQRHIVQQRRAAMDSIRASGGVVIPPAIRHGVPGPPVAISITSSPLVETIRAGKHHYELPRLREWFGDEPVETIFFGRKLTEADRQAIAIISEAEVQAIP